MILHGDIEKLKQAKKLNFPEVNEESLLVYALKLKQLDAFKTLINGGVDVKIFQRTSPLHVAAKNGLMDAGKTLIDRGANINSVDKKDKITPLFLATDAKHHQMMQFFLDHNADPNHESNPSLLHETICKTNDFEAMKLLVKYGADVHAKNSSRGETPLHLAAVFEKRDSSTAIQFLLEHGSDPNALDNWG